MNGLEERIARVHFADLFVLHGEHLTPGPSIVTIIKRMNSRDHAPTIAGHLYWAHQSRDVNELTIASP